tara:strand:+ start:799 stop:1095 length:297 start_codon:yes stop_codon:yes gene_type:complete
VLDGKREVGEHRRKFYQLIMKNLNSILNDEYSPGLHLLDDHSAFSVQALNEIYRFFIVDVCGPKSLEVREHKFIHEFKSLKPFGINTVSPFSITLLKF